MTHCSACGRLLARVAWGWFGHMEACPRRGKGPDHAPTQLQRVGSYLTLPTRPDD